MKINNKFKPFLIKILNFLYVKKYKIKRILKLNYLNNKFIYLPIYYKNNIDFYNYINYSAFEYNTNFIMYKFYNVKYYKITENFKKLNKIFKYKYRVFLHRNPLFVLLKINIIWNYIYLYNIFFTSIFNDIYYLLKIFSSSKNKINYFLILNFFNNKLFVNLQNFKKRNYFFLSTGLFIKFFEKKKSFKKSKTIKLLMSKFIRKLFIISKIKNIILIIKKNPVFLIEILSLLNLPIAHKFTNPIDKKIIEEKNENKILIKILYFIFLKNIDFSLNKGPQRGRIKRKILRKIIINNKIID